MRGGTGWSRTFLRKSSLMRNLLSIASLMRANMLRLLYRGVDLEFAVLDLRLEAGERTGRRTADVPARRVICAGVAGTLEPAGRFVVGHIAAEMSAGRGQRKDVVAGHLDVNELFDLAVHPAVPGVIDDAELIEFARLEVGTVACLHPFAFPPVGHRRSADA